MRRTGWILVLSVASIQLLASAMLLVTDRETAFRSDTGVEWEQLQAVLPSVASQFALVQLSSVAGSTAVGAFSVLVTVFALRTARRWAWFAMWLMPLYMLPGAVGLVSTDGQQPYGYFGIALIATAIAGLVISVPALVAGNPIARGRGANTGMSPPVPPV